MKRRGSYETKRLTFLCAVMVSRRKWPNEHAKELLAISEKDLQAMFQQAKASLDELLLMCSQSP